MNSRSSNAQETNTTTTSTVNTTNIGNSDGAIVAGEGASVNVTDGGAFDLVGELGGEFLDEASAMYENYSDNTSRNLDNVLTFANSGLNSSIGLVQSTVNDLNQIYGDGIASNASQAMQMSRTPAENQAEMLTKMFIYIAVIIGAVMLFSGGKS